MALESRVKKIEAQLTPGAVTVCLSHYPCESAEAVRQRARRALGRPFRAGDIQLTIMREWLGFACPPGQHSHPEDAKIWPRGER